jgi:hypothetical protein
VENTAGQFGIPAVSPFFQLQGNENSGAPAVQIGSFSFSSSGALTFTAGVASPALTPPAILSIVRNGNVNSITLASLAGVQYQLLYTNDAGLASSTTNWTALPPVAGTGATLTLQDTSADADRFYIIEATKLPVVY